MGQIANQMVVDAFYRLKEKKKAEWLKKKKKWSYQKPAKDT